MPGAQKYIFTGPAQLRQEWDSASLAFSRQIPKTAHARLACSGASSSFRPPRHIGALGSLHGARHVGSLKGRLQPPSSKIAVSGVDSEEQVRGRRSAHSGEVWSGGEGTQHRRWQWSQSRSIQVRGSQRRLCLYEWILYLPVYKSTRVPC